MPLSTAASRREIHHRAIDMRVYSRDDGLFDVEARLQDRKPFPLQRPLNPEPIAAGDALHDLRLRFTVGNDCVIRAIEAAAEATPYSICRGAEASLGVLVGEQIGPGWSRRVKAHLRGTRSCTHLMELLIPMATATLQGLRALDEGRNQRRDAQGKPPQMDTCYAYSSQREVVRTLWPEHYRAQGEPE
ncbi:MULTISPECIES: DUF2889 domain-containing protein [Pseudomonas]|uniref:DUF2889 domain-containing protein n=1 Tax=Pseudomonas TaxID=286 RepID=UPI0038222918